MHTIKKNGGSILMDSTLQGNQQVHQLKLEIHELKKQLLGLYQENEAAFQKKREHIKSYRDIVTEYRNIKKELISSKQLKANLQQQRDGLNNAVKELIQKAKTTHAERNKILNKNEQHINTRAVKEKIQQLDTKIETEAMKFDDEKKIMRNIKELKKKLQDAESIKKVFAESSTLSKEITAVRQQAYAMHQQLMQKREEDKQKYLHLKDLIKKIREMKKQEEEMMNDFLKKKSEFVKRNEEMKVKMQNIGPMEQERVFFQSKNRQQREQAQADKIAKLEEAVEQKLKTKKKLTNEDLLVF